MFVLLLAGAARLAWDLVVHWDQLWPGDGRRAALLLAPRCLALAAGVCVPLLSAIWQAPTRSELRWRPLLARILRGGAYILLTAIAVASLAHFVADLDDDRFAVRSLFRSALLLAASLWAGLQAMGPRGMQAAPRGTSRWVGLVFVNLLIALLVLEAVALSFARVHPTRLLWEERSARSTIEANRLGPGQRYLGFTANSRGFYDG